MRTNIFSLLKNQKSVVLALWAAVVLLFALPQGAWAEIRFEGGMAPSATPAAGDGVNHYHSKEFTIASTTPYSTVMSNLGITCSWSISGTALDLSKVTSANSTDKITISAVSATYQYNTFIGYITNSGTRSYGIIYPNVAKSASLGRLEYTAPAGVYFSDSTNFRIKSNSSYNTGYFACNTDASDTGSTDATAGARRDRCTKIKTKNSLTYWLPLSSPVHSFYITVKSSGNYKACIYEQWFYYQIPEVRASAAQDYNSGYALGALAKDITTDKQTLVIKVADGVNASDFDVAIVKNEGSVGTFTITDKTLNAAGTELTIKFTCATGSSDGPISANLKVWSVNKLDDEEADKTKGEPTIDYSVAISGTVGSAKEANTLAWDISNSQFVNTTYAQTAFLINVNSPENVVITSSNPAVCELINGGASIRFKAAGTVTLRAQQNENADYEGADESITVTVSKRTAILAYSESTLFVNTEYPGLISVTNDPNGTLLPNLSYSGADTYMDIEETGDVATKSARTASTTLTITYAGDDEWNPVSTSHDFKVVNKLPAPPFCLADLDNISERVSDGVFITKETNGSFAWNGSALQVTTTGNTYTFVTVRFDGIPNKISFTPSTNIQNLTIKESSDGVSFASIRTDASATAGTKVEVAFTKPASRYVQIGVRVSSGGGTVNLNNFCISDKPMFTVSPATVTIPTDGVLSTPQTVTVVHNDMRSITVTSSDPDFVIGGWTTTVGEAIGADQRGTVQAEVDFVGTDLTKTATLTLTGVPSSGDNIVKTVTARLNATHATHYGLGRALIATENGSGKVYVGANSTTPASNQYAISSERLQWCSGELGADDNLSFYYFAQAGDGYAFDGWYGLYNEETHEYSDLISDQENYVLSFEASSTSSDNPSVGTLYAAFVEDEAAAAPVFALENIDLGSVVSGSGENLQGNLVLLPVGEATRPLYIDRERTTIAFTEIAGHAGEAALFSAGAYASGSKSFTVAFTPAGVHPTAHTYQALATVTATNDMGTTTHTAVVSATVTPAALASFTVDASHTFADKQRNQSDSWNAVVGSLTNATTTPVITITGANAEYFSAGAWDAENHLFPITFAPTAVGVNYTATATISVQNYDEVVTSHTITLKGTCVAAPAAAYDVKDSENQSVVGGDLYFGDFNPGEQATRKLYLVDIANMKEAPGYVPTISMEPDIEGEFVSAAYNASTHSFDVTFHAYGRTDEEMGVRSVPVTITMLNNDDAPTFKTLTLSAFVVRPADYDVRVTASDGAKLLEGSWAEGLAIANANNNSTLRLMRDVTLNMSTAHIQDITNNINLDLNGKTLTVSNLDATYYTALRVKNGKTLKINDSKTGGKMIASGASADRLYAVEVEDGALVLKSGRLDIANTNKSAVGVYVKAGKSFTMNGGELNSRSTGTEGYGVHGEVSGASRAQVTINNGTINAYANASAYGLRGYCDFFVNGGTIHAESTTGSNAYGIDLLAAADATAANGYAASLTMNAGTVEAVAKTTSAYGIRANASFVGSNQEVANTAIHGGSVSALATTTGAYGVYVGGDYNSHNSTRFTTHIDDASIDAQALTGSAYGVYVDATADAATGTTRQGDVDMAETQVTAKTVNSGNTAYGVYLKTTMVKGTGSHSSEVFATASKAVISGGTYKAEAKGTNGYGICTDVRVATMEGDIYPSLSVTDAYIEGKSGGNEARAISSGGNTNVIGGTLVANAGGNNAYGILANTGTVTVSGVTITSEANATAYGVYLSSNVATVAGITVANYATATLNNLDVTATTRTGTEARGISLNTAVSGEVACAGGITVNGGTYRATAATTTAYGAVLSKTAVSSSNAATASPSGTFKNVNFIVKTNGTTSATGIYAGGDVTIDGCNITVQPKTSTGIGIRQVSNTATVTNSTFDVQATADAHLFYGEASVNTTGYQFQGSFDLGIGNNCTAAATSGKEAYVVTLKLAKGSGTYASTFAAATAVIRDGAYKATASGTTAYAINIDAINSGHAPYCEINGGKLWAKATSAEGICNRNNMTRTYVEINGGIYNINTNIAPYIPAGSSVSELANTRAEYSEGYRYEIALTVPLSQMVCQIGNTKYATLAEALAVVTSGQTIYMIADYIVPEGDYTLPAGTTLLIPYKTGSGAGATTAIGAAASTTTSGTTPSKFRKLTFASGAHLTAFGTIETSAQQKANGQYGANVGMPSGPYGQIHLNEGAHISLENGAKLYCWGYVTGKGTIDAKNGSTSLEGFQLGDWCGGTNASNLIGNSQKVFPVTHYFYQSIECPITYRPGAKAIGSTHINVSILGVQGQDNIALVGTSGSMFIMDNKDAKENTWVIKDYDETTDQCVWTVNSGASIGNLTVKVSSYNLASANYDLPITTNMSIVINYGTVSIGQNAVFLPGSKLIVNKEGTADINGVTVVAYDTEDWTGTRRYFASYSPTWGTANPRNKPATLVDAEFFVHGKINIRNNGGIYTSAGGANIHSTNEDAGEIKYTSEATGNKTSYFLVQGGTNKTALTVNPAKLKNGDGSYTASAGTQANKTWIYYDDQWQCWTQDEYCIYRDNEDNPYAKPDGYVALNKQEADVDGASLIHDAATGTRGFIWDENCYWWEVNPTPVAEGVYQTIQPDHNGKYNYYEFNEDAWYWIKKNVTVTFNGTGVTTTNYTIGYGTQPQWLGATPNKSSGSEYYTCAWDGWQIDGTGTVYANDNLPAVTANTTFTSHFRDDYIQCDVTFKDGDGRVLEVRSVNKGSTPTAYVGTPTKTATASKIYTFNGNWSPTIGVVTASTTYTAQFNETTRQYSVTFLNYDNTQLETKNVNYGVTPAYTGTPATPTRPDDTYIYTFTGWKNQLTGVSGLNVVTGDQTYVAQYSKVHKYFNIRFEDADGTTLKAGREERGSTPSAPADPSRDADAQYTYTFDTWTPAIAAVSEDKTYMATYNTTLRSYTIRFLDYNGDNLIAPQVLTYGSTPTEPVSVPDKSSAEEFANWDDVIRTVSESKDYIAQYRHKRYTLSIASNNTDYGTVSPTSLTNIPHGSAVTTSSNTFTVDEKTVTATPTAATAQYTYTFDHWANLPATITGNKDDIQAVFTRTLNQYTITGASAGNGSVSGSGTYDYGATATLTASPDEGYEFVEWNDGTTDNPRTVTVTGTATYTATFVLDETGDYLDIVDWTNSTVTINANGWTASGWPYTVNGTPYAKNSRNADRTLTIPYSGDAGTNLTISVASGSVISNRKYPIPFINTIDGTTETSVVYVNSGKLTIDGSKTLAAVYVAPGAELEITGSLTVGKLFLRTDNAQSAILTNTGTLTATNVYYTRITRSNATYDQFGLPLDCALSSVTMSNAGKLGSSEMPYGSTWNLKSYNEASRAEYGKQDDGSNWTLLAADATIKGGTGYQMISTTKYYREYYFPVDFSKLTNVVPVSYTEGAAGPDHRGWNIICSPLTSVYTVISADPATGIKLNWLEPAGDAYVQEPASTILPARPFAFQTTESCTELVFNNDHSLVYHAPRRVAAADNTETEWLHLDIKDANNRGDQTSLYVHPSRFDEVYEAGVDVAKLSFSASHALLYSSHAYGEMAFAGVADELLEHGVALTVYSPKAQELTISMRKNDWLHRMAFVWLIDKATGAQIDLLDSDYSFNAEAGTTAGRFILMGAFFAPQITTDNGNVQSDEHIKVTKFIYNDKMYIQINGVIYDATGKLVK